MEDAKKHFYAKFKMDSELHVMANMIISESRSTIDEWRAIRSEDKRTTDEDKKEQSNPFREVVRDFEASINTFQRTVPFIMQTLPLMRRISDDIRIRRFVERHSEKLETGEFESYRVNLEHLSSVVRRLQDSAAIGSGIKSIPGLFVVGLVSAYDLFLSKLIRCLFMARPGLLSSSDRNISFKDLTEIGSVEAAKERIIEKEVESVIRESHAKQVDWLENKLDMKLRKDLKIWPEFIEICERRNLLSHTNGMISSQYIAVCKEHGGDVEGLAVGDNLGITSEYYEKAVSVILEFGIKLTQVVWRKLLPDEISIADREISGLSYRLIEKRRYTDAITLLRFALYEMKKHGEEATKKIMVVNLANAEKLGGNRGQAEKILSDEDWSAATDKYKICVAAVRDDVEEVVKLMKPTVDAGHLQVSDFQDWPVFETVRSNPTFVETFEREFGQRIVVDRETPTLPEREAGVEEESAADFQTRTEGNTVH